MGKNLKRWMLAATSVSGALVLTMGSLTQLAEAQTYNVVHSFTGGSDGAYPLGGVTIDPARDFYGTTSAGGERGWGTVYRLVHSGPNWRFYPLYSFAGETDQSNDGGAPYAGVVIGVDGALYGTTHSGGDGQGCKA